MVFDLKKSKVISTVCSRPQVQRILQEHTKQGEVVLLVHRGGTAEHSTLIHSQMIVMSGRKCHVTCLKVGTVNQQKISQLFSHSHRSRLVPSHNPKPLQSHSFTTRPGHPLHIPPRNSSRLAFAAHGCLGGGCSPTQPGWLGHGESPGGTPTSPRNPPR